MKCQNAAVPGGSRWVTGPKSSSDAVTAMRLVMYQKH